ncbi:MAG: ABC transporter permease [Acidimicrobiia bacterium]
MIQGKGRWASVMLPALFLVAFLVLPLLLMGVMSVRPRLQGGIFNTDWTPTLDHYQTVFESGSFLPLLGTSARIALLVGCLATLLAYPLAYFLVFRAGRRASVLLVLLILPFWTSYLLRVIAWKIILGSNGAINSFLLYSGMIEEPSPLLLYNRSAVVVTLVYVWLPFVALPIYAALLRVDRSWLEAAGSLGATRRQTFLKVTLPLSLPGVVAGFLMVFIPTVGEYVAPILVGGTRGSMYGNIIETFFGDGINWPLGSALAFIMLGCVLVVVVIAVKTLRVDRMLEES